MKKTLVELGLSDTESRVYLAMLKLGPSSVQNIAKEGGVSRTAAYELINALSDKGLASTFNKGKKTMFSAEDPEKLHGYFKSRMETMKGQMASLKQMIPELRVMQAGMRPKVRFYTGVEGVHALFRDVKAAGAKELLEMADVDIVYGSIDEKILLEYRDTIHHKKVAVKMLHKGEIRNPRPNTEYREMQGEDFQGLMWLYEKRIALMNFIGDVEVVIIENEIFANTLRAAFNQAWSCGVPTKIKK